MRKCGTCGLSGHNSRTCPDKKEKGSKPPVKKKKTTGRTCGNCGGKGHNRRSCSKATKEEEHIEITCDHNWQPKKKKKVVKCSLCGEKDDHKAKNCPHKPLPEGTKVGPALMECGHFSWWKENKVCTKCATRRRAQPKQV